MQVRKPPPKELKPLIFRSGFHPQIIAISCGGRRAQDARDAGATASHMRSLGCSAVALLGAGYSVAGMIVAGYSPKELLAAGCRYSSVFVLVMLII
jgi:hypothetical protein